MSDGRSDEAASALRVLASIRPELQALRGESLGDTDARAHIARVATAVDRSLRRLLRDNEQTDLSIRLKALAPDELRIDSVLAELRRHDRLPLDLAASIHDLFETRRRLDGGAEPTPADAERATAVVDRLETVLNRGWDTDVTQVSAASSSRSSQAATLPRPGPTARVPPEAAAEAPEAAGVDVMNRPRRARRGAMPVWIFALVLGVVVIGAASAWVLTHRGQSELEQGMALFRSGSYEDAASHFWRYAESHPNDVTPQLYLARIHRRMNRPELAADALREAQRIAPEDAAVHRETGFLLLDTGRPDVAVGRFRAAIEREPQSAEAWVGLVRALRESGRAEDVPAVLKQAPADVQALLAQPTTP